MNTNNLLSAIADHVPFELRRRQRADWLLPAMFGVGLGVALGVGIGIVLAPERGTETRRKLRDGAQRVKDKALAATGRVKQRIEDRIEEESSTGSFLNDVGTTR